MMTLEEKIHAPHRQLAIRRTVEAVDREEFLDYMTFRRPGRPMFTEIFGPLGGVKEAWAAEGGSPAEIDMSAFRYRMAEIAGVPVSTGFHRWTPPELIEETDELLMWRDRWGRTMKMSKRAATLPLPMDWPVATMDDWLRLKPFYEYTPDRLAGDWLAKAESARAAGKVLTIWIPGGFDEVRQLMGEEAMCYACYEQPELVHDILDTIARTVRRIIDEVTQRVRVDMIDTHEDMAGRSGPLWGPAQVEEFLAPYYAAAWEIASDRGARLFRQDSDGDIMPILDQLGRAGLNFIFPCEPTGNMDCLAVRQRFGTRFAIMGGIDKYALMKGNDAIDAELERKLPPLIATGGVVIGLDHRIPNGVTLAAYRHYHAKVWEIIERECRKHGW